MDLTTRCPDCGTAFQVSLQDLQLRKGYIRCIQCSHIFDGYAEVVSEPSIGPAGAGRPVIPAAPPREAGHADAPKVFRAGRGSGPAGREEPHIGRDEDADPPAEPILLPPHRSEARGRATDPVLIEPRGTGAPVRAARPLVLDPDDSAARATARPAPLIIEPDPARGGQGGSAAPLLRDGGQGGFLGFFGRMVMAVLVVGLLLLACAQLVYVYRAQIAQGMPALRPLLERACVPLRCDVPYARDLSQLSISGSALRSDARADEASSGADEPSGRDRAGAAKSGAPREADAGPQTQHYVLNVNLRNLGEHPQEWPTIVLDLNDASGTRLVRRNLSPADYLPPDRGKQPFAAYSEILVRVPLSTTGIQINGYQLDLFFP